MNFIRKILNSGGLYGALSLPKLIFDSWTGKGFTHVEMEYDEANEKLVICPL